MARKAKTKKPASEPKRKTHSLELKLQVLQELNDGTAVTDVCRAFGVVHDGLAVAQGVRQRRI